ncbi:MAG: hypothetical protein M0C28_29975 [Candidatus Moduliflexus flocculans]|nr:hypothetical protein [Candidatus Moduliflexus flocculans]
MIWNPDYETLPREELTRLPGRETGIPGGCPVSPRGVLPGQDGRGGREAPGHPGPGRPARTALHHEGRAALRYTPTSSWRWTCKEIVEIHTSSGTTGQARRRRVHGRGHRTPGPKSMARTLSAGARPGTTSSRTPTATGCSPAAWACTTGRGRIGATVMPISGGNTKRQLELMQDFGTTVLTCTPSYALYLAGGRSRGRDDLPGTWASEPGFFGAEPWSESMRAEIEAEPGHLGLRHLRPDGDHRPRAWPSNARASDGLHVCEDHFFPEIVDPDDRRSSCRTGRRGSWCSPPSPRRAPRCSATGPGTSPTSTAPPAACGRTHGPHAPAARPHRRHAHHPGRQRLPLPDRGSHPRRSRASSRTTSSSSTARDQLDSLEVQVEMNERLFSDEIRKPGGTRNGASRRELYGDPQHPHQGQARGAQDASPGARARPSGSSTSGRSEQDPSRPRSQA